MKSKNKYWIYALFLMSIFILSCEKEDLSDIPSVNTFYITEVTQSTATSGGIITSDGNSNVTKVGVCWSTSPNPTISSNRTEDFADSISFESAISGLDTNTIYYVKAYATNSEGTGYGKAIKFTTLKEISIPIVSTGEIKEITRTSASSVGKIISNGGAPITAHGIVWDTKTNPTIEENLGITDNDSGDGKYTNYIENLTSIQTYYFRAYATNLKGTGYGNEIALTTSGAWMPRTDFGGGPRAGAVSFCIAEKGYIGTGVNGEAFKKDIWQFDQIKNVWIRKADVTNSRALAFSFSINDRAYIGLGADWGFLVYIFTDFWGYNPDVDRWNEKSGALRSDMAGFGFSINGKGYMGYQMYWDGNFQEYNPTTDQWVKKTNFPGLYPSEPASFTIGDKAYVCTGRFPSSLNCGSELWEYDPTTDSWTQKSDFAGIPRYGAVGFSIKNKGYILTGWDGTSYLNDFWEYNPSTDTWKQLEDFKGVPRDYAVGFTVGNKAFIGTGRNDDGDLKDFWEFDPDYK